MDNRKQNQEFEITQDTIRQVRIAGENKHQNPEDRTEDEFYQDVNQQSERIQELVQQIEEFPNPVIRSLLAKCMEAVLTLHGTGLERIFEIIDKTDGADGEVKKNLLDDDFVKGLLIIHGQYPDDLETRLHRALEKVKPYMDSHGGSIQVVSLVDGVATLKLEGSCDGCPSSASTLELGIKQAIEEECPDLLGLEVEGVADNPLAREIRNLNSQSANPETASKNGTSRWSVINGLNNLSNGDIKPIEVEGISIIISNIDDNLYAYRNICPGCKIPLHTGTLEDGILKCKLGHDFEVRQAGKCPDDPDIHLDPFPLLVEDGIVKVAVR